MKGNHELDNRKYVIGGVAIVVIAIYLVRLLALQILSEDYKKNADSNAFFKKIDFPARGTISDRKGRLMVYNQHAYDIMVVMNEERGHIDTLDFCRTLNITPEEYRQRMDEARKRVGYSRFTQQLFMSQLSEEEYSVFSEKMYRYPGFYIRQRSLRRYLFPYAPHILGDVAEVSPADIENDDYYMPGDYIGKQGVERSYEQELRGEKGVQIMLRDAHGRIQGSYQNGEFDRKPVAGKDLTLSIDMDLQALGERLMEGKLGSIVAIEPSTGEVLCMVSSPTYDPRLGEGRNRGEMHRELQRDPRKPQVNRSIQGFYPPGSTFKTSQGLTFLTEGIINPVSTAFPCPHGFRYKGVKVGCHGHQSPISLVPALSTSCNAYFCWGLFNMLSNRKKYKTINEAMNTWRDYMVSMGFGYKLGIDLPGENRGLIPNAEFYDNRRGVGRWSGLSVVSISIGQGEVALTPLQIANLGATIANRGYYYTPHVVRKVQGEPLKPEFREKHKTKASASAYEYIVKGMRASVLGGTCKALNRGDIAICGKTGTAQNKGQDHSVFMGFAPMDNPKIAIAVYVENGGFGAHYGVPIGGLMIEQYLHGKLSAASEKRASDFQHRHIAYGSAER